MTIAQYRWSAAAARAPPPADSPAAALSPPLGSPVGIDKRLFRFKGALCAEVI